MNVVDHARAERHDRALRPGGGVVGHFRGLFNLRQPLELDGTEWPYWGIFTNVTPEETADFEAFMAARWPGLVRAAVLMGADLHAAEDLAQAALVDCHRRWSRVQLAQDSTAYVHRILINRMRASRRRRWSYEVPTDPTTQQGLQAAPCAGGDVAESVSVSHGVREALVGLPLIQRQVVVLRHFCDLSEQQTADVLDVAPGTVKSRLSRAMTALAADPRLIPLRTDAER